MDGLVLGSEGIPSVYKLSRQIKREDVALFHCLRSIASDAHFVQEMSRLVHFHLGLWCLI